MSPVEIENILDNSCILIDTREQLNDKFDARIKQFGCSTQRVKLDYGDYSITSGIYDLRTHVIIERKMDFTELALCFGTMRKRFENEMLRAKKDGCKIYLLIENACYDMLYSDEAYKFHCKSKFSRQAMLASITAWQARYNITTVFVSKQYSGYLIKEILRRELKEFLNEQQG